MYLRLNSLDTHKMPPLARNMVDTNAVTTLATWINSIPATNGLPAPARGSYAELLLAYGPIGYWRFEGSAAIPPIAYDYTGGNDLINANVGSDRRPCSRALKPPTEQPVTTARTAAAKPGFPS
jgi:hypothetical protein